MVSRELMFVSLALRLDHPTAPVLLTKIGPHASAIHLIKRPFKCLFLLTHLKFENELRPFQPQTSLSVLYQLKLDSTAAILSETSKGTSY